MTLSDLGSKKQRSEGWLAAASASNARAAFWLILACLCLFLPGFFSLQPMDRDEPRFAQATRQMLETGDFVSIRFQQEARNKKPVGIYWLQAVSVSLGERLGVPDARRQIWLYRLPSLLAAIAAVLLTYWTALAFTGRAAALFAALAFASTILLGVEARLGKTDATLLVTILAAMGAFARIYLRTGESSQWRLAAIFWTAIGAGLLIKGPITPMIPLLAGIALAIRDRSAPWFRALKPVPGLLWALLLVLPWFAMIMIATNGAFLADSVGGDMLGKVQSGKEAHGAPPLTYFAIFWATAWPMAPFAALAAPFAWKARRDLRVAFLLAWLVPAWLLFEAVPTKLPHYVLPLYPAIAILIAMAGEQGALGAQARWRKAVLWLVPLVVLLLMAGVTGYAIWSKGPLPGALFWLAGAASIGFAVAFALARYDHFARAGLGFLAAICLYLAAYSGFMTAAAGRDIALSPRLARAAATVEGCAQTAYATAGYYEPSLVFLTRTDLAMFDGKHAADFLKAGPCRVAFVESRQEVGFRAALGDGAPAQLRERVSGLNINGGRKLDIGVWVRGPGAAQ